MTSRGRERRGREPRKRGLKWDGVGESCGRRKSEQERRYEEEMER